MKRLAIVLLILVIAAGAAAGAVYLRLQQPYRGYSGAEQLVEIPSGSGTRTIGDRLVAAGVVRDALTFRAALLVSGQARVLKAGEYRFDQPMTPLEALGKIARGEVYVVTLTIPEGLNIREMAALAEEHGIGTAAEFSRSANDRSLIRDLDPAARSLEGYLFPDTYPVTQRADTPRLVRSMAERFERVLTPEMRKTVEQSGLSIHQLVTLASIVEKEAARPDERPLVAAVYRNRLRLGIPLQCDPTVIYALQLAGKYNGNLRRADLLFDSPYNTYRYPGLPPGPIASPGRAALDAAIHPADVDYLYFVSRNDGSHAFARTLEEHNRNVQKYQVEYFRKR
ncbi:MAG: endolytic transglycosylase MltG [Acidobacteriota bacterium]